MSFNLDTSFLLNDPNITKPFSPPCGICNKEIASKNESVFWPTPNTKWAHYACMNQISPAENTLLKTIDGLFQNDKRRQNILHQSATKAVIQKCKPDTIAGFTEKNGLEAVKQLFNTVGIEAAKELAEEMRNHDLCDQLKKIRLTLSLMKLASAAATEFGSVPAPKL